VKEVDSLSFCCSCLLAVSRTDLAPVRLCSLETGVHSSHIELASSSVVVAAGVSRFPLPLLSGEASLA